jgi:hypothetical protein
VRADGQVRIAGAVVLDTATVVGDRILGVDDGSGRLEVVLDRDIVFNAGAYVPGATFAGAGVLVPGAVGSWRLKPRNRDEAAITFTVVSTAAARTLAAGMRVAIEGIALNGWGAFADSTVHLRDATGALRTVRVLGNVAAGDSVRLLGVIATRDGQPVLTGVSATTLVAGIGLPVPDSVSTATAASAQAGTRDAGQVRVGGQITGTNNLPAGDVILTVNDGSGAVEVFMDKDVVFNPGPYQAGAMLRASGVLVPTGTGSWRLKPRTRDDASAFYPTVTVAAARGLQVGQTVELYGTALNSRSTFGDATVHLEDATGSIRILNVAPTPSVLAGYTIRIVGTIAVQNTQPVLSAQSITQVTVGSLPAPDSVSTQVAAAAQGGTRDAGQVAVSGTVSAVGTSGVDFVLTISEGSGSLAVVLDRDEFQSNPYSVGNQIRARGVLIPNAGGTAWELKPRALGEVALN